VAEVHGSFHGREPFASDFDIAQMLRPSSFDPEMRLLARLEIVSIRPIHRSMQQLVYVSNAVTTFNDDALRVLLARARSNNTALGVSGMLLHQTGTFLQVLEGEDSVVDRLYERISHDPRHAHVLLLTRDEIAQRNFADWSMGFVDVRGTAKRLPGFRTIGDLTGLAGNAPAIQRVVASFRDGRWRQAAG
jgi:hypothetical protein